MKNMQKIDVVMLHVGEEQYPQDYLDKVIAELVPNVEKMDCNLLGNYKIMCFADAEQVAETLKGKQKKTLSLHQSLKMTWLPVRLQDLHNLVLS